MKTKSSKHNVSNKKKFSSNTNHEYDQRKKRENKLKWNDTYTITNNCYFSHSLSQTSNTTITSTSTTSTATICTSNISTASSGVASDCSSDENNNPCTLDSGGSVSNYSTFSNDTVITEGTDSSVVDDVDSIDLKEKGEKACDILEKSHVQCPLCCVFIPRNEDAIRKHRNSITCRGESSLNQFDEFDRLLKSNDYKYKCKLLFFLFVFISVFSF